MLYHALKDLFLPIESHNELSTLSTISRIDKRVFIKLESSVHVHDSESVSGVLCPGGYWQEAERALAFLIAAS